MNQSANILSAEITRFSQQWHFCLLFKSTKFEVLLGLVLQMLTDLKFAFKTRCCLASDHWTCKLCLLGENLKHSSTEFPTWTPWVSSSSGTSASSTISWPQHTQWDFRLVSRCPLCSPGFNPARDGDMDRLPLLASGISSARIRNICTFLEINISEKIQTWVVNVRS